MCVSEKVRLHEKSTDGDGDRQPDADGSVAAPTGADRRGGARVWNQRQHVAAEKNNIPIRLLPFLRS